MQDNLQNLEDELNYLKIENMYRHIPPIYEKKGNSVVIDGLQLLNLSSNDYLGISTNNELVKEFCEKFKDSKHFHFSAASSRLLSGNTKIYNDLEKTVANIFKKEAALIFNTGYQCNLGVVSALVQNGDVVFSDKLNHASIIDGFKLSSGDFYRYKHLDYSHLEELLEKYRGRYRRAIIISESVFSMDGDTANIQKLIELKKKYNALLMIDEAHAFCSIDDDCAGLGNSPDIDIVTVTFGKALASSGAAVVSSNLIINYLVNKARSFIFSTVIPPINVMWTNWLLTEKREFLQEQKDKLASLVIKTHKYLNEQGMSTNSETHIIPFILKDSRKAEEIAQKLEAQGFFVLPIRPPSVPIGTSRLRVSLAANIKIEDIKRLFDVIKDEMCVTCQL